MYDIIYISILYIYDILYMGYIYIYIYLILYIYIIIIIIYIYTHKTKTSIIISLGDSIHNCCGIYPGILAGQVHRETGRKHPRISSWQKPPKVSKSHAQNETADLLLTAESHPRISSWYDIYIYTPKMLILNQGQAEFLGVCFSAENPSISPTGSRWRQDLLRVNHDIGSRSEVVKWAGFDLTWSDRVWWHILVCLKWWIVHIYGCLQEDNSDGETNMFVVWKVNRQVDGSKAGLGFC